MSNEPADEGVSDGQNPGSETGDTTYGDIAGKEAYNLYNGEEDLSYRQIAEQSDISKDTVRRRIKNFEGGLAQGQESVEPEDFEPSRLRKALEDEEPEEDIYEAWECPVEGCDSQVQEGDSQCGNCGTDLDW